MSRLETPSRTPRLLALVLVLSACPAPRTGPERVTSELPPPPEPVTVAEGQDDLLFTYRDPESGAYASTTSIAGVPADARAAVVVVDLTLSPEARGSSRYVHVADLRAPSEDGRYPVAVASRHAFEAGSAAGPGGTPATGDRAPVIVYSASWCGVCKKAMRVLRELDVPFEEKDIEASRSALEELSAKAREAGLSPSGVPVIDVRGELMQGLDVSRLKALLQEKGLLRG